MSIGARIGLRIVYLLELGTDPDNALSDVIRTPCSCKYSRSFLSNRGSFSHKRSPYWRDTEIKARKMPGLRVFSIAVNSVFLSGKKPIFGGFDQCTHLGFLWWFLEKIFIQGSLKNFQSKSAWKFLIKLRLIRIKFFNRDPVRYKIISSKEAGLVKKIQ